MECVYDEEKQNVDAATSCMKVGDVTEWRKPDTEDDSIDMKCLEHADPQRQKG